MRKRGEESKRNENERLRERGKEKKSRGGAGQERKSHIVQVVFICGISEL